MVTLMINVLRKIHQSAGTLMSILTVIALLVLLLGVNKYLSFALGLCSMILVGIVFYKNLFPSEIRASLLGNESTTTGRLVIEAYPTGEEARSDQKSKYNHHHENVDSILYG